MKIIVLIKQVPDMEKVKFDKEKGRINRASAGTEINPFDLNALETALQISEKTEAEVIALSMGPPQAEESLKEAIARGAHEGILLSDSKFGGSDVKATANILSAAIKKIGNYDLVIAGIQTVDGDTGQVGPEIAGCLGIPHISNVECIKDYTLNNIDVVSNVWEGLYLKRGKFPILITVTKDVNTPRLPSFKNKMKARKAEITKWNFEELKEILDETKIGINGSATKVKKIEIPSQNKRDGKVYRDNDIYISEILNVLKENKVLQ
ncbi:electron transfer flavoprotein subunit beta/FixA family protein [Sedimentibacter sp. MB31-C6]|uniref:electron transfer flavoprotein subunit beta/FixA family protein n=1 Tax=Sedimentibacter sp. MB31-C6 TaxID=3109366 RepID=UPI002DDD92D0|nr:electron transfer flavoprotein subunit beta/FixA family protein [Sedimentibacter sp. MB36-C1]WSI03535.1 electron transfer flavoprotein subunit beta/FixA family protein [Sedimentibacter sp. MB36-C1]